MAGTGAAISVVEEATGKVEDRCKMRLLDLDDDTLLQVAVHACEHAAFTVLVCKRLRRLTRAVFHPMPVTCNLGTLVRSRATFAVYQCTRSLSGDWSFEDAVLRHGEESFVMDVFANSERKIGAAQLIRAGRVDILRRGMEPAATGVGLGTQRWFGKPHVSVSQACVEIMDDIRFLSAEFTGKPLRVDESDRGSSLQTTARRLRSATRLLVLASEAPEPATLEYIVDSIHGLAAGKLCNLHALLGLRPHDIGVDMLKAAILRGGPGNVAYVLQQVEQAIGAFGASHERTAGHLFLGVCAYMVSRGPAVRDDYAMWQFLQSVDWKARGYTLHSAICQYVALARTDRARWFVLEPETLLTRGDIFNAIRDKRSLSIVRSALEVDGGWLLDTYRTACVETTCLEYICLFGNDNGSLIDIDVAYDCTKRLALDFLLLNGSSSCFVTKAMFKLLQTAESGKLSAGIKAVHCSCTLVSELWTAATSDGTREVQKRARKMLYGNNFVFHTLIVSFRCKRLRIIDAMLEQTPSVAGGLTEKQRNYLLWQGSRCYAPEQLSPVACKLLSVSEEVARDRCQEYRAQAGTRRLPDFRCT